eukprot:CAMPEP_0113519618 /NCGR_PEP_ID=MMETSP0014_2-20120614/43624_1 /TAXON_ID=2857 /ORGANISM="Nitzschia sp." /LENGTH=967 /DNA_ID=CAMNT_0000417365 /DNA_START=68 /DNA_END=2969 /DNA_ORIENTATION=+ /assembly_acc=CAM_ASM_000159
MDGDFVNSQLGGGTGEDFHYDDGGRDRGRGRGRAVSTTETYHQHVDYTSKALERQAELEELRKKALAKDKAGRLQDAEAPKETLENFMNRQRALFDERRKNEAEALHALHQYRADDELVLRLKSNIRSSSSSNKRATNATSASTNTLNSSRPTPPDPDVHCAQNIGRMAATLGGKNHHQPQLPNFSSNAKQVEQINNGDVGDGTFCVLTERIEYSKARLSFMQKVASEACQVPLPPEDEDDDDDENEDEDENEDANGNTHEMEGGDEQTIRSHDSHDHQTGILIAEEGTVGSHDDIKNNDNDFDQGSSQSFIPYESFLKLGEAFETDTVEDADSVRVEGSEEEIYASRSLESSTTVSSTIPIESFLQLGATLMVESTPSQPDYNVDKANAEKDETIKPMSEQTSHHVVVIPGDNDGDDEDKTEALTEYPSQVGDDQHDGDNGRMIVDSLSSTLTESIPKVDEQSSSISAENWTISSSTIQLVKAQEKNGDSISIDLKEQEQQQHSDPHNNIQEQTVDDCSEEISPPLEITERSVELHNDTEEKSQSDKSTKGCLSVDRTIDNNEECIDESSSSMVGSVEESKPDVDSDVALGADPQQQEQPPQQEQHIEVTDLRLEESADTGSQAPEAATSTSTRASNVGTSTSSNGGYGRPGRRRLVKVSTVHQVFLSVDNSSLDEQSAVYSYQAANRKTIILYVNHRKENAEKDEQIEPMSEQTSHHVVVVPGDNDGDDEDKTEALTEYPSQVGDDQHDGDNGRMIVDSLSSTLTESIPKVEEPSSSITSENWTISSSTLQLVKAHEKNGDSITIDLTEEEQQQHSDSHNNIQEQTVDDCSQEISTPLEIAESPVELNNVPAEKSQSDESTQECLLVDRTIDNNAECIDESTSSMVGPVEESTLRVDSDVAPSRDPKQQEQPQQQEQHIEVTDLRLEESVDTGSQAPDIGTSTVTRASNVRTSTSSRRRVRSSRA